MKLRAAKGDDIPVLMEMVAAMPEAAALPTALKATAAGCDNKRACWHAPASLRYLVRSLRIRLAQVGNGPAESFRLLCGIGALIRGFDPHQC